MRFLRRLGLWNPGTQEIWACEGAGFIGALQVTLQISNPEMLVETLQDWIGWGEEGEAVTQAYEFNQKRVILDVPPQIVDGRTLVPLRAVSEIFRADVEWCGDTRTVTIER